MIAEGAKPKRRTSYLLIARPDGAAILAAERDRARNAPCEFMDEAPAQWARAAPSFLEAGLAAKIPLHD